jgi:hypothetical protein
MPFEALQDGPSRDEESLDAHHWPRRPAAEDRSRGQRVREGVREQETVNPADFPTVPRTAFQTLFGHYSSWVGVVLVLLALLAFMMLPWLLN